MSGFAAFEKFVSNLSAIVNLLKHDNNELRTQAESLRSWFRFVDEDTSGEVTEEKIVHLYNVVAPDAISSLLSHSYTGSNQGVSRELLIDIFRRGRSKLRNIDTGVNGPKWEKLAVAIASILDPSKMFYISSTQTPSNAFAASGGAVIVTSEQENANNIPTRPMKSHYL